MKTALLTAIALSILAHCPASAEGTAVRIPNPSFETAAAEADAPHGWRLSGDEGVWLEGDAADGQRAVAVAGTGQDASYWRTEALELKPHTTYRLTFEARRLRGQGGTPMTGPVFCNRDLGHISQTWEEYSSIFLTPTRVDAEIAWLRFGQSHLAGAVAYDDVALVEVQPLYRHLDEGIVLGAGEFVDGNVYFFKAPQRADSHNHSRPIARHQCSFNTYRWVFGTDSEVVYCHSIGKRRQLSASVGVEVSYHVAGELVVAVSSDGESWQDIGRLGEVRGGSFPVPPELLPADSVWVRLSSRRSWRDLGAHSAPGSFQVAAYEYEARLDGPPVDGVQGSTHFVSVSTAASDRFPVTVVDLGSALAGVESAVTLQVDNPTQAELAVTGIVIVTQSQSPGRSVRSAGPQRIPPGRHQLQLPYRFPFTGRLTLAFELEGDIAYRGQIPLSIPEYYSTAYGQRLPTADDAVVEVWWAASGWKVAPQRQPPEAVGRAVRIETAKGEAEAAQLVLRPKRSISGIRAVAGELTGPEGARLPAETLEILQVNYVPVQQPTDATGVADLWPDPILPLRAAGLNLEAGRNQPLWIRATPPRNAAAGVYRGFIELTAPGYRDSVAIELEVYDFVLPQRMTCQTAFGFSPGNVWRYHNLTTEEDRREVLAKYWRSFSAHHISPYDPAPLDRLQVSWPDSQRVGPTFEWAAWDTAMRRAIDAYRFNSFRLPIPGMGGGTFHRRYEPELLGYDEGDPQYWVLFNAYCRAIEDHLRERGWLDEAFVYWFDEPAPKDYDFVMNGFAKLAAAAPGITRMLTEQVEDGLVGGPDLWCPVSPSFQPERARQRRRAGERFWWYLCTVPKAPYCTIFIDHPATELRVWLWQTWARDIEGILVWATNYWTSDAAYPEALQDPYTDTMSWMSEYSAAPGARRPLGNGDGRFIYPPRPSAVDGVTTPVLEGPVETIRWEMLRDGIEDYEYLALLERLLDEKAGGLSAELVERFAQLLEVPEAISASMTEFTRDPAPIAERRRQLAAAIASLSRM